MELDGDFLRESIALLLKLAEVEVEQLTGAKKYEPTPQRRKSRNGYRQRTWERRVGEIDLRIPKLRSGSYFPSLLEPRRRAVQALLAMVQSAYVQGVSTRRVDVLLQSLGLTGIDKSRVSRICKELDALCLKVRQNQRIVNMALVIAIGVRESGEPEALGLDLSASEDEAFWLEFLRQLVRRGLRGVRFVISDVHQGLKEAVGEVLSGASWQRCRMHLMRNVLARVPKGDKAMVAAAMRTIFSQPNREAAGQHLQEVVQATRDRWPQAAKVLERAEEDVLAYMAFLSSKRAGRRPDHALAARAYTQADVIAMPWWRSAIHDPELMHHGGAKRCSHRSSASIV